MESNNYYFKFEEIVFEKLSPLLKQKGWNLKRQLKSKVRYDIALFFEDELYTFIEIKLCKNKHNFKRVEKAGIEHIRKNLNSNINYGILFINGQILIVGKNTSERLKFFPKPSDYNWRKVVSYNINLSYDSSNYDEQDVKILSALLEIEKLKKEKEKLIEEKEELKQENEILREKNQQLIEKLVDEIAYARSSLSDEELKIKLIDDYFLNYSNSIKRSKKYINDWCYNWNVLEPNSKLFIEESENLYKAIKSDYTAFIHGFAKALETEILNKIFLNFLEYFNKNNVDIEYQITDKDNISTIKVFRSFLKKGDLNSFLSLDKMRFIISSLFSDTQDKLLLEFKKVYLNYFKEMNEVFVENGSLDRLKKIRNKGAHIMPIEKSLADEFFIIFKSTINELLTNYKINK